MLDNLDLIERQLITGVKLTLPKVKLQTVANNSVVSIQHVDNLTSAATVKGAES
jgi:hypothetical protein